MVPGRLQNAEPDSREEANFIKTQQAYAVLKTQARRKAFDAAFKESRMSAKPLSRKFTYNFENRNLTSDQLIDLVKTWESECNDANKARKCFRSFLNVSAPVTSAISLTRVIYSSFDYE